MRLAVRLFALLRERAGAERLVLDDLPEGLDVAGLKRALAARHPELGDLASVRAVLGTRYVPDATELAEGAEVALLPPVSGGAPGADLEQGVFELVREGLDVGACYRRVLDPACGAVSLFVGTTRATSRGASVTHLEYEAFEAMTGPEMGRIFERCRAAHGEPLRMLCQHRVGRVGVGEPSVVIAVASPHRAAACAASRFLIDELKASLPIWKKEHYQSGAEWVGERS